MTQQTRRCLRGALTLTLALALGSSHASDWAAIDAAVAQNQWPLAQGLIETGLRQHPRDARLRLLLGVAQARTDQLTLAKETLTRLSLDHPELSEAHNNLGIVLALGGDWVAAAQSFERARLADPNNVSAQQNLARVRALVESSEARRPSE